MPFKQELILVAIKEAKTLDFDLIDLNQKKSSDPVFTYDNLVKQFLVSND